MFIIKCYKVTSAKGKDIERELYMDNNEMTLQEALTLARKTVECEELLLRAANLLNKVKRWDNADTYMEYISLYADINKTIKQ